MLKKVQIEKKWVGDGEPCLIIAEAGSNHDGDLRQAMKLIDHAVSANADAVKYQVFRAQKLYPKSAGVSEYLKSPKPIYDIIEEMEMPYEWLPEIAAYCRDKGIIFLASVFDEDSVDQLEPHVGAFKIASYEMTHIPLVRYVAKTGKPIIVSTGTATLEEVATTVEEIRLFGNDEVVLMQCTGAYPAPLESLNLRAIATMKRTFGVPVGFSDHSRDPLTGPMAAAAIGANLIEKHFTLDNNLPGPDHRFALEPDELQLMVQKVREVEQSLGNREKVVHPLEEELRNFARRCIFAIKDISEGEALTKENIAVLRCGNLEPGLDPKHFDEVLDKHAAHHIPAEQPIQDDDFA